MIDGSTGALEPDPTPASAWTRALYGIALILHSWLRWPVLLLGVAAVGRAAIRWRSGVGWTTSDDRWGLAFLRLLGIQVLLGLALYLFLSPLARAARVSWGATMADGTLRFFGIEHAFGMIVGIAVAEGAWKRTKRMEPSRRARLLTWGWLVWLVIAVASIPWPWLGYGRPLFRG